MRTWIGIAASFGVAAALGVLHYADANAVLFETQNDLYPPGRHKQSVSVT